MFLRRMTVSVLTIGLAACGIAAQAQQTQPNNPTVGAQQPRRAGVARRGIRRRARMGRLHGLKQLNLTDAQRQQARSIIEASRKGNEAQRNELRQLMQQARTGTLSTEQQARAKELRQQLMAGRKAAHSQMLNVLTAEQKAQLEEIRKTRRANKGKRGPRNRRMI